MTREDHILFGLGKPLKLGVVAHLGGGNRRARDSRELSLRSAWAAWVRACFFVKERDERGGERK